MQCSCMLMDSAICLAAVASEPGYCEASEPLVCLHVCTCVRMYEVLVPSTTLCDPRPGSQKLLATVACGPFYVGSSSRGHADRRKMGMDKLDDDALLAIFLQFSQAYSLEASLGNPARGAAAFVFVKNVLPLVCRRWNAVLKTPACPLFTTIHVSALREVGFDRPCKSQGRCPESAHPSASILGTSPGLLGSSPSHQWTFSYMARSSTPSHNTPGAANTPSHSASSPRHLPSSPHKLSFPLLRAERVLQWIASRGKHCQVLILDISHPNHDLSSRSVQQLLGLVRPSLKVLHLADSPGQGRQEGYEVLSTLKSLQQLYIQGIPQDFLHLCMPFLAMLTSLHVLHFKPDMAAYPSPARLASFPPCLADLHLVKLWIEQLPPPYNRPGPGLQHCSHHTSTMDPVSQPQRQPQSPPQPPPPPQSPPPPQQTDQLAASLHSNLHVTPNGNLPYVRWRSHPHSQNILGEGHGNASESLAGAPAGPSWMPHNQLSLSSVVSAPLGLIARHVPPHAVPPAPSPTHGARSPPTASPYPLQTVRLSECQVTAPVIICLLTSPLEELHLHKCSLVHSPLGMAPGAPQTLGELELPAPSGLQALTMSACGVRTVSGQLLQQLLHLESLDLSHNEELGQAVDAFPHQLACLVHLTRLELRGCGLLSVPAPVAALPALTHLNLELNALSALPKQLACSSSLRVANISSNRLMSLPACVLTMSQLQELVVSAAPLAGTPDLHVLHQQLPALRKLQVKGATYDARAVRNIIQLNSCVQRSGSQLVIDIVA